MQNERHVRAYALAAKFGFGMRRHGHGTASARVRALLPWDCLPAILSASPSARQYWSMAFYGFPGRVNGVAFHTLVLARPALGIHTKH
jgi:hypothetical protein